MLIIITEMVIISTHIFLNNNNQERYGPFQNVESFLIENNIKYVYQKEILSLNPFKILIKIVKNLILIYRNKEFKIYIGIDPINALAGIIGKKFINKNLKVIFYSIDFSKNRTGIKLLDLIYVFLDRFVTIYSDESWSCSYRVFRLRESYIKNKNFFVPNIPYIKKPNLSKYPNFTVVFTGYFNRIYRIDFLKELIKKISSIDINLIIVGEGEEKQNLETLIKEQNVQDKVFLKGYLKHKDIIDILDKSHIGLALYSGSESYDEYRDSMKIREFIFLELPTICTDKIPNAEEVNLYELGKVITDFNQLFKAIKFYNNKENFETATKNCKEYNSKFDIKSIYKDRIIGL